MNTPTKEDVTIASFKYTTIVGVILFVFGILYCDYLMISLYFQAFFWSIFFCMVLSYPFDFVLAVITKIDSIVYPRRWYTFAIFIILGIIPLIQLVVSSTPSLFTLIPMVLIVVFLCINRRTLTSLLIIILLIALSSVLSTVVIKQSVYEVQDLITILSKNIKQLDDNTFNMYLTNFEHTYFGKLILNTLDSFNLTKYLQLEVLKTTLLNVLKQVSSNFQPTLIFNLASSVSDNIFALFIFIYSLMYFLIYKEAFLPMFSSFLPLDKKVLSILRERVMNTSIQLITMNLLLFLLNFFLTFFTFKFALLPFSMIASIVCGLLSIIPAVSNMVVWLPAGVYLFFQGNTTGMIWFITVHAVTYFVIDGFFYSFIPDIVPYFVGLSVVFGIYVFGTFGCIIGPILLVMTLAVKDIFALYSAKFKTEKKQEEMEKDAVASAELCESKDETCEWSHTKQD
ncbi:hypothetical protein EIN_526290 [Entamoeba invadens IP1]|uniref:AI-2E family transporter n=1 Tax=Entamoeba invadens IP1 TaxID=370355 RepID=A0A0A1UBJ7_ENTIV|nr:hypothetical protein EIN_526290 [Entamoeba invadens IP1]ELP89604.1 hypothetical protein EIN_526290 [Entamoeba invadens IP1]|eukprot:XP_004256375.1 hypothetical protein EIN_526290 [Entamoeba invadens IP1]